MSKPGPSLKKFLIAVLFLLSLSIAVLSYLFYTFVYRPNVELHGKKQDYLYIPTGSKFNNVLQLLISNNFIRNKRSFVWMAEKKNYSNRILPGRYRIIEGMNNEELINLLRSGKQEPLKFTFSNIRTKKQLASLVGSKLEADSTELLMMLNDSLFTKKMGFNNETIMCLFIPNTYEFFWTTSDSTFIRRMAREYRNFWNNERREKAIQMNMTPEEVTTLASIVQEETNMISEKPVVAGVYLNRIKRKMPLEADPTLRYAMGDFSVQRILNEDKKYQSPYNTYKYTGLPPGPINLPSIESIDAVLNYTKHDYLFFCAREDFSGYSNFAKTYSEHLVNARKFQAELNRRNINR